MSRLAIRSSDSHIWDLSSRTTSKGLMSLLFFKESVHFFFKFINKVKSDTMQFHKLYVA